MDSFMEKLADWYHRSLVWSLAHRFIIIAASVLMFATSMLLMTKLKQELIPPQDQSLFLLNLKTPGRHFDHGH